ncbi:MAG: hypothetical protein ACR2NP_18110, partial [Pirellulaceae bacterium]
MNQRLLSKIARIGRRVRLLAWMRALLGLLAALIIGLLIIGVVDWWLRPRLMAWTFLVFAAVWLLIAAAVYRWVWPALLWRPGRVELARRIERVLPDLRDRLSTSVEVAEINQREGRENSPLENSLIAGVNQQLDRVAPRSVTGVSFVRRAGLAALIAASLGAVLWWWQPANVSLGLQRLTQPWLQTDWPRRNDLVFSVEPPHRISRGDSLVLLVRDRNGGPVQDVRAEVQKFTGGGTSELLKPVLALGTPDTFHFQLDDIQQSLRIRVVGGDSQTRWYDVDVFERPAVIALDVRVRSVDETESVLQETGRPIRCRPGSTLTVSGTTNVPVALAEMVLSNGTDTWRWPGTRQPAQESFALNVDATEQFDESEFWIELESLDGDVFVDGARWRLELIKDNPPIARVNSATLGNGVTLDREVGLASVMPLKFIFRDEGQIDSASWQLSRSGNSSVLEFPLVPTLLADDSEDMIKTFVAASELAVDQLPDVKVGDQ